ncbi:MAG: SUMF1/EgtB/PvdO family nonheme iron enzyme [Anaerolineae bacterium]|nr:SUMF1/EgtB/PvdO family nonheme iron enzyme [Anaerolineae bacterium]
MLTVQQQCCGVPWQLARRVVRGGSWNNNQNNARCAYRNNNNPNNRNNNIGFRVVCASHIFVPLPMARALQCSVRCEVCRLSNAAHFPDMLSGYGF